MADIPHPGKERFCWVCGVSMGFIENRYYDRMDSCGATECAREERDAHAEEREEAHRDLNRWMGYDDGN